MDQSRDVTCQDVTQGDGQPTPVRGHRRTRTRDRQPCTCWWMSTYMSSLPAPRYFSPRHPWSAAQRHHWSDRDGML